MQIGAGVSRWTMLHLKCAIVTLLVAQVLLAARFANPIDGLLAPQALIVVHLVTIGWLSVMMLGALYQFVPVITNSTLFSQRLPILSLVIIFAGLVAMVAGFLALAGMAVVQTFWLPLGGSLVVIGFALGIANVAATLWRVRPLPLPARFIALGIAFLMVTALVGLGFALAFSLPDPPLWLADLLDQGLMIHVLGGLGGWVTLTAMGVSYRLLSMFMLAPDEPRWASYLALYLTAGGLLVYTTAGLAAIGTGVSTAAVEFLGAALAFLGAVAYLIDILHLYRVRVRRHLELNSIAAAAALGLFACVALGAGVSALFGTLADFGPALGYLFVFGWLSGLGLSQLYKIVPFMTWLEIFGKRLGKGPVPRVQDLVNERRAAPWFVIYFVAVVCASGALAIANALIFTLATIAHFVATLAIAVELWRAHRPDPNAAPKPLGRGAAHPFAKSVSASKKPNLGG